MSLASTPAFGTTISALKSSEPSLVTRLTICTFSTVPSTVAISAGTETCTV